MRTTLFENITNAVNTYGPIIYMDTNGAGGGTTESLSSITALIAKNGKYRDLISSNNNNEFRISPNLLGWGIPAAHIMYHTTYFNCLKMQVRNMTNISEICNINYGDTLLPEYATVLNQIVSG